MKIDVFWFWKKSVNLFYIIIYLMIFFGFGISSLFYWSNLNHISIWQTLHSEFAIRLFMIIGVVLFLAIEYILRQKRVKEHKKKVSSEFTQIVIQNKDMYDEEMMKNFVEFHKRNTKKKKEEK